MLRSLKCICHKAAATERVQRGGRGEDRGKDRGKDRGEDGLDGSPRQRFKAMISSRGI